MKAKKIVAVVMGTAIAATLAVSMSACGGSKKPESLKKGTFNIANYAEKYEVDPQTQPYYYQQNSYEGVTAARMLFGGWSDVDSINNGCYVAESNGKYAVYDVNAEKVVLSNLSSRPQATALGSLDVIRVSDGSSYYSNSVYYAYDGTVLLPYGRYYYAYASILSDVYVGRDTEPCTVYRVSATKSESNASLEDVEYYFKLETDEETDAKSYVKIEKKDITLYAPEYAIGSEQTGLKKPVYEEDEDHPVEGEMKDYEYSVLGSKYTFYKDGKETGAVDLTSDGEKLAFMDNCMYYCQLTPYLESEHKGYNIVYPGVGEQKFNYTLYKYDIVANATTRLNYDVAVLDMKTLYNHETKSVDAAVITGYKMTDGVASISAVDGAPGKFSYVIDKNFNLGYDMTGIFSGVPSVYDLGNDKYYVGGSSAGYITDAEFNVLCSVSGGMDNIYVDEGLVRFRAKNGNYGFTDFNGKVVIAPEYSGQSSIVFYGGVALVSSMDSQFLLRKDGHVVSVKSLTQSDDPRVRKEFRNIGNGAYMITTDTSGVNGENKTEVDIYSYGGKLLRRFSHTSVMFSSVGGKTVIEEAVYDSNYNATYNYYKLV